MKALCVVAHPDDCVIFAYSFIHHWANLDWTIAYLTYSECDSRAQEFQQFWNKRNIPTMFLGYVDDYRDLENKIISFDTVNAAEDIKRLVCSADIVLTHNLEGDYGHLHHVFVHNSVVSNHNCVVTFAGHHQGTDKYSLDRDVYDLNELPLHKDVIQGFHSTTHTNEYNIPEIFYEKINGSRM